MNVALASCYCNSREQPAVGSTASSIPSSLPKVAKALLRIAAGPWARSSCALCPSDAACGNVAERTAGLVTTSGIKAIPEVAVAW
eukprot:3996550-Amphidinium_carterae.1